MTRPLDLVRLAEATMDRIAEGGDNAGAILEALQHAHAAAADRTDTAEGLLALIFALRPSDDEAGQSWVLKIASTALARAILGTIGPNGDAEPLLAIALEDVRTSVVAAQSAAIRSTLTRGPRGLH